MFEIYRHKGTPQNIAVSPQGNMTSSPQLNGGINAKQLAGIGIVAAQLIPAGKQVFNSYVDYTGSIRLQNTVDLVGKGIAFLGTAATLGLPVAIGVQAIKTTTDIVSSMIEDKRQQITSEYNLKLRGAAINNFTGKGVAYD